VNRSNITVITSATISK